MEIDLAWIVTLRVRAYVHARHGRLSGEHGAKKDIYHIKYRDIAQTPQGSRFDDDQACVLRVGCPVLSSRAVVKIRKVTQQKVSHP